MHIRKPSWLVYKPTKQPTHQQTKSLFSNYGAPGLVCIAEMQLGLQNIYSKHVLRNVICLARREACVGAMWSAKIPYHPTGYEYGNVGQGLERQ